MVFYDRFIPVRSGMELDYARNCLSPSWPKERDDTTTMTLYQQKLKETLLPKRSKILAFNNIKYPPDSSEIVTKPVKKSALRYRNLPSAPEKIFPTPNIWGEYCFNRLDWGSRDFLALALNTHLCLWNCTYDVSERRRNYVVYRKRFDEHVRMTNVAWSPDGLRLATGMENSHVRLLDMGIGKTSRPFNFFPGGQRITTISWKDDNLLTIGAEDGTIRVIDMRIGRKALRTHHVDPRGDGICLLKWSPFDPQLAVGSNNDFVRVWDVRMDSDSNNDRRSRRCIQTLEVESHAAKCIDWCPFQKNILATVGGDNNRCLKFLNTQTGTCVKSVDTGSEVAGLIWRRSTEENELLSVNKSGTGNNKYLFKLWKYPSMVKMAESNREHSMTVYMSQSPDGCTVASSDIDERLNFWNMFGHPKTKPSKTKLLVPFLISPLSVARSIR